MKRFISLAAAFAVAVLAVSCSKYETVAGDPMKTRIYTLDNGLKVYMSVNRDEPRIQAYIAVRSGSKDDPSDNTGLAHYLEHIMFKGTESFGTSDYAAEKPLLDEIEDLFEVYKQTDDPAGRKALYHRIDSISYAASQYAIPNEYDKLMAAIGGRGSNAFTSNDITCYVENIPSNQVENWARIQADRFKNPVIRGFHTELETVYEEYNMYLNEDSENALLAMDSVLFSKHPYGLQSTIGTSEHLKNPSITAIKKQKSTFYVPNNVAICVSGDFDPDDFIATVEKYFGDWQPNPELPERVYEEEDPITEPVRRDVYGTDSDFLMLGWRYPGSKVISSEMATIVGSILDNGQAGLFDLDITQKQKLLSAGVIPNGRVDYGEMILMAYPKEGQTLEEAGEIMLAEVARLRAGDFDDELLQAVIANWKLDEMSSIENNSGRVSRFYRSFIAGHDWADDVHRAERFSKVTKQDVVDWANEYLGENSYVAVYKHHGANPKNDKIEAPSITPIATNRDKASDFLVGVQNAAVAPIEPVFVDFSTDLSVSALPGGAEVLYKKNEDNDIATLTFRYDIGSAEDPALPLAFDYVSYLGTAGLDAGELASREYRLACSHSFSVNPHSTSYTVSGLGENIPEALKLVEDLLAGAVADEEILASLKQDVLKSRVVSKLNQNSCNAALRQYLYYGPEYVRNSNLPDEQVMAVTSEELLSKVKDILSCAYTAIYYGPLSESGFKDMLRSFRPEDTEFRMLERHYSAHVTTPSPKVVVAPYDSRQFNYTQYTCSGEKFSLEDTPAISLYNEYFGSGMNAIVFQEMREARGLAYSARAQLSSPSSLEDNYTFFAFIGSQNDKLRQAVDAFDSIINDMPQSEKAFNLAKAALEAKLRTARTRGRAVLNSWWTARELGLSEPLDKYIYEHLSSLTMEDLMACQQKWVKGRTYTYGILGDIKGMDVDFLKTLGPVQELTLEDIFGY